MGIKNGILQEPRVDVETTPGHWVTSNTWPVSDNDQVMTFHADGSLTTGAPEGGTDGFVNSPSQSEAAAVAKGSNPNRLLYVSGSLKRDLRISGGATVDLTITPNGSGSVGQVGVALVDYGNEVRVRDNGDGHRNLGTSSCWGESVSYDDACYIDVAEDTASFPLAVLARGWARLKGQQENTVTVDLAYNDVVVQKGDQLGLAIFGASPNWLVTVDGQATPYKVDLKKSSLTLPIVGGLSTAANAGDMSQVPKTLPKGTVPVGRARVQLPY
jgi:X-Pro dipeptidyl-peptidase